MRFGNRWMKKLNVRNKKISYGLQLHCDQSEDELKSFWRGIVGNVEIRIQRKSNSGRMKGRNWNSKYGVLSARFSDYLVKAKIDTWIDCMCKDMNRA